MDENVSHPSPVSPQPATSTAPVTPPPITPIPPPPTIPETTDMSGSMPPSQITPRNKIVMFLFCVFIALVIAVIFFYLTRPKTSDSQVAPTPIPVSPTETEVTPEATGSANTQTASNLPPLYPGVEWEEPVSGEVNFHDENFNVVSFQGRSLSSVSLEAYPFEFIEYYKNELEKNGWTQTSVAGEPELDGGFYEYKKGTKYILFGVKKSDDDKVGRALIQYN